VVDPVAQLACYAMLVTRDAGPVCPLSPSQINACLDGSFRAAVRLGVVRRRRGVFEVVFLGEAVEVGGVEWVVVANDL